MMAIHCTAALLASLTVGAANILGKTTWKSDTAETSQAERSHV